MSDRSDIDAIKDRLDDPREVAHLLGLDGGKVIRQGRGLVVCCPAHGDRTPSLSITVGNDGTLRARCFGCDLSGDVFDLVAGVEGLDRSRDFRAVLEAAASLAGIILERGAPRREPAPRRAPKPPPPVVYPPEPEVLALLNACVPCRADAEVSDWLRGRSIDPELVDLYGLALALPEGAKVHRWAFYKGALEKGAPWPSLGFRLLIPMRDASGRVRSVRARAVRPVPEDLPKALPPSGFDIAGLVMADHAASMLLGRGTWSPLAQRRLVVSEGESDYLTAATHWQDDYLTLACIGIVNGSWTEQIANRIPDGSRVIVRTDQDDAGDVYSENILTTLRGRCDVVESDPEARAERRRTRPARIQAKREALRAAREAARAAHAAEGKVHEHTEG